MSSLPFPISDLRGQMTGSSIQPPTASDNRLPAQASTMAQPRDRSPRERITKALHEILIAAHELKGTVANAETFAAIRLLDMVVTAATDVGGLMAASYQREEEAKGEPSSIAASLPPPPGLQMLDALNAFAETSPDSMLERFQGPGIDNRDPFLDFNCDFTSMAAAEELGFGLLDSGMFGQHLNSMLMQQARQSKVAAELALSLSLQEGSDRMPMLQQRIVSAPLQITPGMSSSPSFRGKPEAAPRNLTMPKLHRASFSASMPDVVPRNLSGPMTSLPEQMKHVPSDSEADRIMAHFQSKNIEDVRYAQERMQVLMGVKEPDKCMFNSALHLHSLAGNAKVTELWLMWMISQKLKPTGASYACAINACAQAGDAQRAEAWMTKLVADGIAPTEHSYNAVINACAQGGFPDRAEDWLNSISVLGLDFKPNVVTYNTVIHAFAKGGNLNKAEYYLEKMVANSVMPNEVTIGTIINACAEAGDVSKAEIWLKTLVNGAINDKLKPNEFIYNAVIKACVNTGNVRKAEEWAEHMTQNGFPMTPVTYNLLIHSYAKEGKIARAEFFISKMEEEGCQTNRITYNSVINACATKGDVDKAHAWLQRMLSRGIDPDQITYGAICKAYAREGNYRKVQEIMQILPEKGIKLNEYFYASFISACGSARPPQPMLAEQAFIQCIQKGFKGEPVVSVLRRAVGHQRAAQLCDALNVNQGAVQDGDRGIRAQGSQRTSFDKESGNTNGKGKGKNGGKKLAV